MILVTDLQMFLCSLYRAQTLEDAEEKFNLLFQRLPYFMGIVKEVSVNMEPLRILF